MYEDGSVRSDHSGDVALGRRKFLSRLAGLAAAAGAIPAFAGCDPEVIVADAFAKDRPLDDLPASLRDAAAGSGRLFGAASSRRLLEGDLEFAARFVKDCAMLVPEAELKWGTLRPAPDSFDFSAGDWLASFADVQRLRFRGHTLVWHSDLPPWFASTVTSANAERYLTQHITTVAGHFAGRLYSWDVVNEGVYPADGRADGLRRTPWLEFLGPDYIDLAFRTAAAADPAALLVYNENGMDYDTPSHEAKRTAVLALLTRLLAAGVPVHALGVQAHLRAGEPFSAAKLGAFLREVAGLGLQILITEMDVADSTLPADLTTRDRIVADAYAAYLDVALAQNAVTVVNTWGLSDRYTWLAKSRPRPDGAPVRPLPLDADLRRKAAWSAIARAFESAPIRRAS